MWFLQKSNKVANPRIFTLGFLPRSTITFLPNIGNMTHRHDILSETFQNLSQIGKPYITIYKLMRDGLMSFAYKDNVSTVK